jgi:hypothetical protein
MPIITQLELLLSETAQLAYGPFISRKQAHQLGLRHYYTGVPCRNGHVSVRGIAKWNCLQCDREAKAAERLRDPERVRANERRIAAKHRRKKVEVVRQWRKRNPDRLKHYTAEYRRLYRTDAAFRARKQAYYRRYMATQRKMMTNRGLGMALRNRLYCALRRANANKNIKTHELIGCTITELRQHLEAQFTDGMTWHNYGKDGWHIDHIRPCASFDLSDSEQQRQCFHYSNLQPLWALDNIRKGARWDNAA